MRLTQNQCRDIAQTLYPKLWKSDPIAAITKAISFIQEAAHGKTPVPASVPAKTTTTTGNNVKHHTFKQKEGHSPEGKKAISSLRTQMAKHGLHLKVVSRAIGVSPHTVRTWIEGTYSPRGKNIEKILEFLASIEKPDTQTTIPGV